MPNTSFLLQFRNKHQEFNNFCVQLVQKFQILTEKINIEVLFVAHFLVKSQNWLPKKIKVAQIHSLTRGLEEHSTE